MINIDMSTALYMQRVDIEDQPQLSLEGSFPGLKYVESSGISEIGKPKNQYTENYADSNELRTYIPDSVCNDSREVALTLLFIGDDRRLVYQMFMEYISAGVHRYTDNVRGMYVDLLLTDAVEISEDIFNGSVYYITSKFKFKTTSGVMMINGSSDEETIGMALDIMDETVECYPAVFDVEPTGSDGMYILSLELSTNKYQLKKHNGSEFLVYSNPSKRALVIDSTNENLWICTDKANAYYEIVTDSSFGGKNIVCKGNGKVYHSEYSNSSIYLSCVDVSVGDFYINNAMKIRECTSIEKETVGSVVTITTIEWSLREIDGNLYGCKTNTNLYEYDSLVSHLVVCSEIITHLLKNDSDSYRFTGSTLIKV